MILFFDTETTGLVNMKAPDSDASQPRLVQLAALLCEEDGNEVTAISVIVRPDNFEIPSQASNVHGITTEYALKVGLDVVFVIDLFTSMLDGCSRVVAHNFMFDKVIMNNEISMTKYSVRLQREQSYCTMLKSVDVCKLPNKNGRKGFKWPKLIEVHQYLFNEGFDNMHNALADVQACKRVYFELMKRGIN